MTKHIYSSKKTQQNEQLAVQALMMEIGEVPVVGQILGAVGAFGMVLDDLDPYGYNNSIDRDAINQGLDMFYGKVDDAKEATIKDNKNDKQQKELASYDGQIVTADNKDFIACYYSDRDDIDKLCKLPEYKEAFKSFYDKNKDKFIKPETPPTDEEIEKLKEEYGFDDNKNLTVINNNKLINIVVYSYIFCYCLYLFLIVFFQQPFKKLTSKFLLYFVVGTVVIAGIFVGIFFAVYHAPNPKPKKNSSTLTPDGKSLFGKDILIEQASDYAHETWCKNTGNIWTTITKPDGSTVNQCLFSEQNCNNSSNTHYDPKGPSDQKPFLIWSDNQCIRPNTSNILKTALCDNNSLPYQHGDYKCTPLNVTVNKDGKTSSGMVGFCKQTSRDTCIIIDSYCKSKGMDFDSSALGDCYINDIQNILEAVFGRTIVRKIKQNVEAMEKECKNKFWSSNCAESIFNFVESPDEILFATTDKFLKDGIDAIQNKCTQTPYTDKNTLECYKAMEQLNPVVFASKLAIKMIEGLIDMSLGKIFGFDTKEKLGKALDFCKKYGAIALASIVKFGETALKAFENGYDMTVQVLNNLGGPFAIMGFELEVIGEAVHAMAEIGKDAVIAFLHIGEDIVHSVAILGADSAKLLSATIGCFLHPKDFAKNMKALVEAAVGTIKDVAKILKQVITDTFNEIGHLLKDAINIVKTFFVTLANKIATELWNDIKDLDIKIGEDVVKALDFVEKSVEEIGKQIGREVKKDVEKIIHWLKI